MEGWSVQQGKVGFAAKLFCHHRTKNVGLVVVGECDDQVRIGDIGLVQNLLVQHGAIQDNRGIQFLRGRDSALPIRLDDLDPCFRLKLFNGARNILTDIASASDYDTAGFLFLMAKKSERSACVLLLADDIGKIAKPELLCRVDGLEMAVPVDADHSCNEIGRGG